MKDIYILGSGGFAKEVYFLITSIQKYDIKGFIDIKQGNDIIFGGNNIPVLSEEAFLKDIKPNQASIAMGIGEPALIQKLALKFSGYSFPNLIHPGVVCDFENVLFGQGNVITAGVIFTTHIKVGNFNIFNLATTVGHDVAIGDYNVLNPAVNVSGGVTIGNTNLLGVGCTILQYKNIGNNVIVGASSLVTKDVDSNTVVVGVPAKKMNNG